MIVFLSPLWLWALLPIALAGSLALWRGRHNRQRISSTLLWQSLGGEATEPRRRIDPVWLSLFIAAVLAALAVGAPALRWGGGDVGPRAELQLTMRALPGADHAELFVKAVRSERLPESLTIVLAPTGGAQSSVPIGAAELAAGKIIAVPRRDQFDLQLLAGQTTISAAKLTRVAQPRLVIYRHGLVSPALRRAMEIQPGARVSQETDPASSFSILLVGGPVAGEEAAVPAASVALPPRDGLVVFTAIRAPADLGVQAQRWVPAGASLFPTAACPLPASIWRAKLPAGPYRAVTLSGLWAVLVRAGNAESGDPYVAVRRDDERNITYVYIASDLAVTRESWPADPSFVILMSSLVDQVRPSAGGTRIATWTSEIAEAASPVQVATHSLAAICIFTAAALILVSVLLLVRRTRA